MNQSSLQRIEFSLVARDRDGLQSVINEFNDLVS